MPIPGFYGQTVEVVPTVVSSRTTTPRFAKLVTAAKEVDPKVAAQLAALGADSVYSFGEDLRQGKDFQRAAIDVAGNTLGAIALHQVAEPLAHNPYVQQRLGNMSAAIPTLAGFGGILAGGYAGDRVDEYLRPDYRPPTLE